MNNSNHPKDAPTMSDSQFYQLHKKVGKNSLHWRRKFIGMLPEAYKRHLHDKKGYHSIFEYAAKLCGLSQRQVREVLNLEERFKETPQLHELLISGEVSSNKLSRVASIATKKNEEELAQKVKILSKNAVETMVRDFKNESRNESKNGLDKPKNDIKLTPGRELKHEFKHNFELSEKVQEKLQDLHQKGHDINQILLELLEKRETEIQEEKDEIAQKLQNHPTKSSRNIPVRVKKVIRKEFGCKCAVPGCRRPSKVLHHTNRFAMTKQHNPHFIAPLCKAHHEIAHSIDLKVYKLRITTSSSSPTKQQRQ